MGEGVPDLKLIIITKPKPIIITTTPVPRDILISVYSMLCDLVRKQLLQNTVVFACISFPLYPLSWGKTFLK